MKLIKYYCYYSFFIDSQQNQPQEDGEGESSGFDSNEDDNNSQISKNKGNEQTDSKNNEYAEDSDEDFGEGEDFDDNEDFGDNNEDEKLNNVNAEVPPGVSIVF